MKWKNNRVRVAMLVVTSLLAVAPLSPPAASASRESETLVVEQNHTPTTTVTAADMDQIRRLYLTTLDREPGEAGQVYWADLLADGHTIISIARYMLATPEAVQSTGDLIVDAYRNALGRVPDDAGYAFWSQYDSVAAVVAISDSVEHVTATGTLPPPIPRIRSFASQIGWIDAGHGVFLPPIMLAVRECESSGNYRAANPRSSARGAYQFLTGSWAGYGHAARYGVRTADKAAPAEQDEAAALTWLIDGTRPWNASRHCWS